MKWSCCAPLLLIVAIGLAATSQAPAQQEFRWNLAAGEEYALDLKVNSVTQFTLAGEKLETTLDFELHNHWRVVAVNEDGQATIEQSFDRVVIDMILPHADDVHYDSVEGREPETPQERQLMAMLCPLYGRRVELTMNKLGELESLVVLEDDSEGTGPDGEAFDPGNLKASLRNGLLVFPAEGISQGDQWTEQFEIPNPVVQVVCDFHYTYVGAEQYDDAEAALFELTTTVVNPEEEQASEAEAAPTRPGRVIGLTTQGKLWFDQEAGRMLESQIEQQLEFQLPTPAGDADARADSVVRIRLTPVEAAN